MRGTARRGGAGWRSGSSMRCSSSLLACPFCPPFTPAWPCRTRARRPSAGASHPDSSASTMAFERLFRWSSRIEAELGPIDIWVNDAMVSVFARADEITPEEFRRVTDVTYLGYVWGTLAALRRMKRRHRGTIVQVGSALAYRSIPLQSAYCAAKHAIKGFTEALRTELLHDRVAVDLVMVELPAVNTPQFDWSRSRMPRRAQPVPPI